MQQGTRGVDSEQEQPEERRGTAEAVVSRLAAHLPARVAQDAAPHPPPLLHVQGGSGSPLLCKYYSTTPRRLELVA